MAKVVGSEDIGMLTRHVVEYTDKVTGEQRTFNTYTCDILGQEIQFQPKTEHRPLLDYLLDGNK